MSAFEQAIQKFDEYNSNDPKKEIYEGIAYSANLLYAMRMTDQLAKFEPEASQALQLAARSQHIGRWEIPRSDYTMDRKGYLQWRSQLKILHGKIASAILQEVRYDQDIITRVKDLLLKKQLKQNKETQALEDVVCLVFLEFYFDDFSADHDEEKLVNILRKTIPKMSERGVGAALKLPLSEKAIYLIGKASEA